MLLFYTQKVTPRLRYICDFVFTEMMGLEYGFTTDPAALNEGQPPAINYSNEIQFPGFQVAPAALLFETTITSQDLDCFTFKGNKAFYKTAGNNFPFDVFAASFYLLSRYEEYLPHTKDIYGRYGHESSLAFREDFLQVPLINRWIMQLAKALQQQFPELHIRMPEFSFKPTYDIDIAYSYQHKGFIRNTGGFLKQPSLQRLKVLLGKEKDPFDVYEWLDDLHTANNLQPLYFFLVAEQNGRYDKNILPSTSAMQQLIIHHAKKYKLGIHPSWQSGDKASLLPTEKQRLEKISSQSITSSRQHYLRFNLPDEYRNLLAVEITDDYSMGYGTINGFRASVANSFFWYDLEKEASAGLRIHPFCFMDSNCFYQQHLTPEQALEEITTLSNTCKLTGGTFISIWHNQFFGTDPAFAGWRNVYDKFIAGV